MESIFDKRAVVVHDCDFAHELLMINSIFISRSYLGAKDFTSKMTHQLTWAWEVGKQFSITYTDVHNFLTNLLF